MGLKVSGIGKLGYAGLLVVMLISSLQVLPLAG